MFVDRTPNEFSTWFSPPSYRARRLPVKACPNTPTLTRSFPALAMELSSYALLIAVAASAAVAISFHTRRPFPRVGNQTPFGIGYLITAFKATTKGQELIEEGLSKYPGKPFVLPTLGGSLLFTANKADVELMKKSDDSMVRPGTVSCSAPRSAYPPVQWNQPIAINEVCLL